jgi:hypothetical protein
MVVCVVQCFPHVFHNVLMHFSSENNMNPSINVICVKKHEPFYPTKFEMMGHAPSIVGTHVDNCYWWRGNYRD